jgi:predicted RNA-binding protein
VRPLWYTSTGIHPARFESPEGRLSVCDLKAYVLNNDKEELLLESVNHVRSEGGEVVLRNLFGEEKRVQGEVREVSLVKNRVIVVPR